MPARPWCSLSSRCHARAPIWMASSGAAKRRGAGEVKVADRVHGHAMEERGAVYARGLDILLGTYRRLELTPPGRPPHVTEFPCPVTYDHQS
jgi:predicted dithiol-disulfide oxidoreductase (DUF899 family)